jgi:hypothetical protein
VAQVCRHKLRKLDTVEASVEALLHTADEDKKPKVKKYSRKKGKRGKKQETRADRARNEKGMRVMIDDRSRVSRMTFIFVAADGFWRQGPAGRG